MNSIEWSWKEICGENRAWWLRSKCWRDQKWIPTRSFSPKLRTFLLSPSLYLLLIHFLLPSSALYFTLSLPSLNGYSSSFIHSFTSPLFLLLIAPISSFHFLPMVLSVFLFFLFNHFLPSFPLPSVQSRLVGTTNINFYGRDTCLEFFVFDQEITRTLQLIR